MNLYTVLLLRPDHVTDNFGHDTYLGHVVAETVAGACIAAQMVAILADGLSNDLGDENWVDHTEYHVLFVCLGHQTDLSPEYTGYPDPQG